MAENPYKGFSKVEQFFLNGVDDTTYAIADFPYSGAVDEEINATFDALTPNASLRKTPQEGQLVLVIEMKTTSGSGTVTIYGKNVYGSMSQDHAEKWVIKSGVTLTTTSKVFVYLVHVETVSYDPNSTGIRIGIDTANIGDNVEYRGRLIRV